MTMTRRSGASSEPQTPPPKLRIATARSSPQVSKSPKRPSFINSNDIVSVIIVEKGKHTLFSVHKSYLTAYSKFFQAAFNGLWAESASNKIEIKDVTPAVFEILVAWLYTQKLANSTGNTPIFQQLMELWLLGDRFQIPRLQNESIEALNRQATELTRPHSISFHHVYENTMEESPLRLFLAALSAQGFLKEAKKIPSPENYPHEMLIDMLNWAAKHHKKLVKFSQADLVQYFVAENEPTSSLRSIGGGSPISPVSPDSPSSDSTLTSLASSSSFIDF